MPITIEATASAFVDPSLTGPTQTLQLLFIDEPESLELPIPSLGIAPVVAAMALAWVVRRA